MTRNTGIVSLTITSILVVFFLTFSGCSDSINSPLSPESSPGDYGLAGGGNENYASVDPTEEWDSYGRPDILGTHSGEDLSEADITLEYDDSSLPKGIELRVVFTNPHLYEFHIVPPGHARETDIHVTINYSKADLSDGDEGGDDDEVELIVYGIDNEKSTRIDASIDRQESSIGFDTEEDFARYALARD